MNGTQLNLLRNRGKKKQDGVVAIVVVILLPALLGFAALAVDVSYGFMIKNELQNAADSTALAGAGCLYARADCSNLNATVPDWSSASTKAQVFASNNSVENSAINTVSVEYGYWDASAATPSLRTLPYTPTSNDSPAVKVTVNRSGNYNGGEVQTFFARIWGINSRPISASAVALITSPGNAGAGSLFPVAITKCLFDNYWDAANKTPKVATSTNPPGFDLPQTVGKPYVFKITSSYHAGVCESGQWTSLDIDSNNVPTIRDIITNGNSGPIAVGDDIWIQPGSKTALYADVDACSYSGNKSCEYVMVPVVEDIDTHAHNTVVGLACMRIISAAGGSDKSIVAHLTSDGDKCQAKNAGGVGPGYGMLLPARLAY